MHEHPLNTISVSTSLRPLARRAGLLTIATLLVLIAMSSTGCSLPRWRQHQAPCVLDAGVSKETLVDYLNRNVDGAEGHPVLRSWRSGNVRLHVDGIPMSLPASIAVEAPRNFRMLVSNPITGGQEVDIGSNPERFWIWSKEAPQVLTASHEDVGLAMQELEMPVHIHPDWLMEVFGVVPLHAEEFELIRPKVENGEVELLARRQSPLGEDVERVIRVNVCQGRITEHLLRLPGGKVLARARMEKYSQLPNGLQLPTLVRLEWPDARMQMVMDIRKPEVNSPSLANNAAIWQMPHHGEIVDIGAVARRHNRNSVMVPAAVVPVRHEKPLRPIPGRLRLPDSQGAESIPDTLNEESREFPAIENNEVTSSVSESPEKSPFAADSQQQTAATDDEIPEWARETTSTR